MPKKYVPSVVLKGGNLAWPHLSLARPSGAAPGAFVSGRELYVRTYATEISGDREIVDEHERRYFLDVAELRPDDPFMPPPTGSVVIYVGASLESAVSVVWRPGVVVTAPTFGATRLTVLSVVDATVRPVTIAFRDLEPNVRAVVEDLAMFGKPATNNERKNVLGVFGIR